MSFRYHIEFSAPCHFLPEKKEEHRLSRYALKHLVGDRAIEIENHLHLRNHPEIKVSVSHTKGAGAAIICEDVKIRSVGIDIEWSQRPVKEGIEKFYINERDDQIDHMKLWMAKEAAFKAISPLYTGDKILVLKDIVINADSFSAFDQFFGKLYFSVKKYKERKIKIACALLG